MARVQHFGPFIGINLASRGKHAWALGPFPKLLESTVDASAHPWPQPAGSDPRHQPHWAEIAVTSLHSQITPENERFLVLTVENISPLPLDGYNIRVTLTFGGAGAEAGS